MQLQPGGTRSSAPSDTSQIETMVWRYKWQKIIDRHQIGIGNDGVEVIYGEENTTQARKTSRVTIPLLKHKNLDHIQT